jgi:hypothetical protein
MNQNIKLMPTPQFVKTLQSISHLTTITTAHQQYCTQYYRNYYGVPLHKLSVWISAEQYFFKPKKEKENLLIYSPDFHQDKEKIINKLQQIKGLQLQMIENLTYTQYKQVISKAKWAITFGEGLDGYFTEPIFSGAISFAVHNKDFFTDDFVALKTVYQSYQDMYNNIVNDITILEEDTMYNNYQQQQYSICHKHYDSKDYKQNIANFYKQDFTFK